MYLSNSFTHLIKYEKEEDDRCRTPSWQRSDLSYEQSHLLFSTCVNIECACAINQCRLFRLIFFAVLISCRWVLPRRARLSYLIKREATPPQLVFFSSSCSRFIGIGCICVCHNGLSRYMTTFVHFCQRDCLEIKIYKFIIIVTRLIPEI
jgi:hypothetical protein